MHVNVGRRSTPPGAALARREAIACVAAGVVGLSLAGKLCAGRGRGRRRRSAGGAPLPVPAGGFAQVGRAGNAVLVDHVLQAVGTAPGVVLELYAGSGNFTRTLIAQARPRACSRAKAIPRAVGARPPRGARAQWSGRIPDMAADVVVLDPPREGADARASGGLAARAPPNRLRVVRPADAFA